MYSAFDIAQYVLYRYMELNRSITNLKLQKLLYFIQRQSLQVNQRPMFNEIIEAWQFGPVVPAVYYKYVGAGASEIYEFSLPDVKFEQEDIDIMEDIINKYIDSNPWVMVDETHNDGTAWDRAVKTGVYKPVIDREDIRIYG
jgi:uncharacterized phage-associated protein